MNHEVDLQLQTVELRGIVTPEEIAPDGARAVSTPLPGPLPVRGGEGIVVAPVADVASYLASRKPCTHFALYEEEEALFVTLPAAIKDELVALIGRFVGGGAFGKTLEFCQTMSLHQACRRVVLIYSMWNWSATRFRARFDLWQAKKDWAALVNKAKAGIAWQSFRPGSERGLSEMFLKFVEARVGEFRRSSDGMRQAVFSIHRQWRTGFNHRGELEAVAGYGFWQEWFTLKFPEEPLPKEAPLPPGWGYDNLRAILRKRLPKGVRKLLHEGSAAAKPFLPGVLRTRAELRFLEEVTFDDVKLDYRVLNPATGEICDMWILLARCTGTALALGFVQRPTRAREDGSQEHLNLRDMKQLTGIVLETYGLPPYRVTWKLERGTATLSEGSCAALEESLPERIKFSFNSMLGGTSSAGYREKGKGNSAAKASHESHNRLIHTMSAGLPGQTGPVYARRPADLKAREDEAVQIWETTQLLPAGLRDGAKYPLLTLEESRRHLFNVLRWQNARTEHRLEGFDEVIVWRDPATGEWRPRADLPLVVPAGVRLERRMESPYERAAKLIQVTLAEGLAFERVAPDIITSFYAHTQRRVKVSAAGEIAFQREGRVITYRAAAASRVQPGETLLAHYNEEDPARLYCTDGKGAIVGIWARRDRASNQAELAAQLRYTQGALKQARAQAAELDAQERGRLEAMREHNARMLDTAGFSQVVASQPQRKVVASGVATALVGATQAGTKAKTESAAAERAARQRRRAVLETL